MFMQQAIDNRHLCVQRCILWDIHGLKENVLHTRTHIRRRYVCIGDCSNRVRISGNTISNVCVEVINISI